MVALQLLVHVFMCCSLSMAITHSFWRSESYRKVYTSQYHERSNSQARITNMIKTMKLRGGGSETDAELDAYVESLIAGVSDGGDESFRDIVDKDTHQEDDMLPSTMNQNEINRGGGDSSENPIESKKYISVQDEEESASAQESFVAGEQSQEGDMAFPTAQKLIKRKRKRSKKKIIQLPPGAKADQDEDLQQVEVKESDTSTDMNEEASKIKPLLKRKRTRKKKKASSASAVKKEKKQDEGTEKEICLDVEQETLFPISSSKAAAAIHVGSTQHDDMNAGSKLPEKRKVSHQETEQHQRVILPPNSFQRFLLSQGYVGRALATLTIFISEFIHRYLPELHRLIVHFCSIHSNEFHEQSRRRKRSESGVHSQYAAFASGHTVGSKKISKDQKKQLDKVALGKLKQLGGVKRGKYAYLSTSFMKKYNLGKYADEAKMFESIISPLESGSGRSKKVGEIDEGSDSEVDETEEEEEDWVVRALSDKKTAAGTDNSDDHYDNDKDLYLKFDAEPSISVGTNGASIGMDLNLNFPSRKKKTTTQSVIEAAHSSTIASSKSRRERKDVKVKSDKEGGSGMLGRLRAVGANSVGSRIFGAYPGDAVPIEEAASRHGVVDVAQKYGYGDWSDEGETDGVFFYGGRKRRRGKKMRRRKKTDDVESHSDSKNDDDDFAFGFPQSSGNRGTRRGKKRVRGSNRRSNRSPGQNFSVSFEACSSPSTTRRHRSSRSPNRRRSSSLDLSSSNTIGASATFSRNSSESMGRKENSPSIRPSREELEDRLRSKATSSLSAQAPMRRSMDLANATKKSKQTNDD